MKSQKTEGIIYAVDHLQIKYAVCKLTQVNYEDDSYEYIFEPNYKIIDLLDTDFFQGIPGLDLELRKERYVRANRVPTFIYERTPQENREDLYELLEEYSLEYLDPLEWLIRSKREYTGDNLQVDRYEEALNIDYVKMIPNSTIRLESIISLGNTSYKRLKTILQLIANGSNLYTPEFVIDDKNRENFYGMIKSLYEAEYHNRMKRQKKGIEQAKGEGKYKGRKQIQVSIPKLAEVSDLLERRKISSKEAMEILGLKSKSTLYRKIKAFREDEM
jgi:hypothetical protein